MIIWNITSIYSANIVNCKIQNFQIFTKAVAEYDQQQLQRGPGLSAITRLVHEGTQRPCHRDRERGESNGAFDKEQAEPRVM